MNSSNKEKIEVLASLLYMRSIDKKLFEDTFKNNLLFGSEDLATMDFHSMHFDMNPLANDDLANFYQHLKEQQLSVAG